MDSGRLKEACIRWVPAQITQVVDQFVYLGSVIHSSTLSTPDIIRRSGITRAAMQSLDNHCWKSRISIPTKLKLHRTCILPVFLYGSECWAVTKVDARRIDSLDQWCLRTLLGIKWRQFVRNEEVRRITKQPNLTVITQSWHLFIFGHTACMDDDADAKMILTAPLQRTGRDHQGYIVLDGDPASPWKGAQFVYAVSAIFLLPVWA